MPTFVHWATKNSLLISRTGCGTRVSKWVYQSCVCVFHVEPLCFLFSFCTWTWTGHLCVPFLCAVFPLVFICSVLCKNAFVDAIEDKCKMITVKMRVGFVSCLLSIFRLNKEDFWKEEGLLQMMLIFAVVCDKYNYSYNIVMWLAILLNFAYRFSSKESHHPDVISFYL